MKAPLYKKLKGILACSLVTLNTLCLTPILLFIATIKLILPFKAAQHSLTALIAQIGMTWIQVNRWILNITQKITWDIVGVDDLKKDEWYFVTANHQSWADIIILQHVFADRTPMLKFFIKQELIWIPLLGLCWWALDFPFMKRYSKAYLAKHPEKKGKDFESTQKACQKFQHHPTAIMNFLEGSRFTESKHKAQQSPYQDLLKPKAGGFAYALNAMQGKINRLIDVTIHYHSESGKISLWDLCCGEISQIQIHVQTLPIPLYWSLGDYQKDEQFRHRFQLWLAQLWASKAQRLTQMKQGDPQWRH